MARQLGLLIFPSNKSSEKVEMKIRGQEMRRQTFRVKFGLDIYIKSRGIGVVFSHISKIVYRKTAARLDSFV